jgi:uncharacterized protein (TIRG00374 family)
MNRSVDLGVKELVWFGVAGAMLLVLVYLADVEKLLASLRRVDIPLFSVAVAVGSCSLLVWAWVWHRFFDALEIVSTPSKTVRMFLAGHFLNSVTPLGQFGGEPLMAYVIADATESDYERALASVISADLLNALPFFTFSIGGLVYLAVVGSLDRLLIRIGAITAGLLLVGALVAYLLWSTNGVLGGTVVRSLDALEHRVGRGEAVFQSVRESVRRIEDSFERAGADRGVLLRTMLISHLAILAQILSLYFVFLSLGLDPAFVPLYLIVNLSAIATVSPTPGGTGTYEAAFSALVTLFYPVGLSTALSAAILFRLTTYWPGLLAGYPSLLTLRE